MKKKIILIIGLVLIAAFPNNLFAQVAEEEIKLPEKLPNTGYSKGFFIQNDDGSYKLTLKGQARFKAYYFKETKTPDPQLSFQFRSASLTFNAKIAEKGSLGFDLLHSTSSIRKIIIDPNGQPVDLGNEQFVFVRVSSAVAAYTFIPEFGISIGMVGLPLDLSTGSLLTEAPQLVTTQIDGEAKITPLRSSFGAPEGIGINFSGGIGKFDYEFAVINANEDNYQVNPNREFEFGGRIAFSPFDPATTSPSDIAWSETPKLTFNLGGFYQNKRTDPYTNAIINYQLNGSAGGRLQWKGLGLTAQGYYRLSKFANIGQAQWARPKLTDIGYYVDAGYFVIPKKLEIGAEAEQVIRQGPDNNSWAFGGGLNYYVDGDNFKLQLDYMLGVDFDDINGTQSNKAHKVAFQTRAKF